MAITKADIELKYKYIVQQADKLDAAAQAMSGKTAEGIERSIGNLRSVWTGDNAQAFLKKEEQLKLKVLNTVREMHITAAAVRNAAQDMYDTENVKLRDQ